MSRGSNFGLRPLGVGVSVVPNNVAAILRQNPTLRWCELNAADFIGRGGFFTETLETLRTRCPLASRGWSLSLAGADPLDAAALRALSVLCERIGGLWHVETLAASCIDGVRLDPPVPPPFTHEALRQVADRARTIQYELGRPLLVENAAQYLRLSRRGMDEAQFLAEVAELADCGVALNVSNVVLNADNLGYDPYAFVEALPLERVGLLRLGAFAPRDDLLIAADDEPVAERTWDLYRFVLERVGKTSAAMARRGAESSVESLLDEARLAQALMDEAADATSVV